MATRHVKGEGCWRDSSAPCRMTLLKLDENFVGGNIHKEMENITKLQKLFLRCNNFFGVIPPSFLYLKELEELDLRGNLSSMEIPVHIGDLSNMTSLALSNNRLTGRIPSYIQKLAKLETLGLENNLLTG